MDTADLNAFAAIDWQVPWLSPFRTMGQALTAHILRGDTVAAALNTARQGGVPPRFVPQNALLPGEAYETFVFRTGDVPTRDNLHDFFNGLVWLHEPQLKRIMNELQAARIAREGVRPTRGALRDALTLLDENGARFDGPPMLWQALRERSWRRAFVDLRDAWDQTRVTLVGHALMEKLTDPRKSITAHLLPPNQRLGCLTPKDLTPLPVLGIPGWWSCNAEPAFYADPMVFRPPPAGC